MTTYEQKITFGETGVRDVLIYCRQSLLTPCRVQCRWLRLTDIEPRVSAASVPCGKDVTAEVPTRIGWHDTWCWGSMNRGCNVPLDRRGASRTHYLVAHTFGVATRQTAAPPARGDTGEAKRLRLDGPPPHYPSEDIDVGDLPKRRPLKAGPRGPKPARGSSKTGRRSTRRAYRTDPSPG